MPSAKAPRRARLGGLPGRLGGPFRNLRVAQKLFVSFGLLCLVLVAVGGTAIVQLSSADSRLEAIYRENLQATARIGEVRADVQQMRALSAKLILRSALADI